MIPSEEVRKRREAEGLSQAALADRLGCSQPAISYIESGTIAPALKLALKIETWSNGDIQALSWLRPDSPPSTPATEGSSA
jgi:transcriptional regulator with XRE-family HTH domain